jgi:hypothetical protein
LEIALAAGLYLLCRQWGPDEVAAALLTKLLVLAAFPALVWKTGILRSSTVTTLGSAKEQAFTGVSRFCGTIYRKALS